MVAPAIFCLAYTGSMVNAGQSANRQESGRRPLTVADALRSCAGASLNRTLNMTGTRSEGPKVTMIDITLITALVQVVAVDPAQGYQAVPASYLTDSYFPRVELNLPLFVLGVDAARDIANLARALRNAYPQEHELTVIWAEGGGSVRSRPVSLADYAALSATTPLHALYVPPLPRAGSVTALQEIVAHLRSPEGCPWDRAQTLQSLRHDLLSECAEVIEAIDVEASGADNSQHISEELGDLLLGVVLLVQIATDGGRFQMADVVDTVVTKLRRRHPHVFADVQVDTVETVLTNWDAIKAQEKAAKGAPPAHPLDGVPAALPALEKARQLQSKAAKAGLLDRKALAASNPALAALVANATDEAKLGELLWQLVAQAHNAELNAEDTLRSYVVRFREENEGK
jgi:tetrapyrrole methylase family protein/MazG family protein